MTSKRKELNCALLKGIETGDAAAVAVVNEEKYIHHNPQAHEGSEGLASVVRAPVENLPSVKGRAGGGGGGGKPKRRG